MATVYTLTGSRSAGCKKEKNDHDSGTSSRGETQCPICFESCPNQEDLFLPQCCGVSYHKDCWDRWNIESEHCPTCRSFHRNPNMEDCTECGMRKKKCQGSVGHGMCRKHWYCKTCWELWWTIIRQLCLEHDDVGVTFRLITESQGHRIPRFEPNDISGGLRSASSSNSIPLMTADGHWDGHRRESEQPAMVRFVHDDRERRRPRVSNMARRNFSGPGLRRRRLTAPIRDEDRPRRNQGASSRIASPLSELRLSIDQLLSTHDPSPVQVPEAPGFEPAAWSGHDQFAFDPFAAGMFPYADRVAFDHSAYPFMSPFTPEMYSYDCVPCPWAQWEQWAASWQVRSMDMPHVTRLPEFNHMPSPDFHTSRVTRLPEFDPMFHSYQIRPSYPASPEYPSIPDAVLMTPSPVACYLTTPMILPPNADLSPNSQTGVMCPQFVFPGLD